jgi:hypothetical protein
MRDLKQLKIRSWGFYKFWRERGSYSPALKVHIQITRRGWDHILGYGKNRKRSKREIMERLANLRTAKLILESAKFITEERRRGNVKFYKISGRRKNQLVSIVIMAENGKYYLLSIFVEEKNK